MVRVQGKGNKTTHVAIVVDRSGSMETCRDATISGFNEYIGSIRHAAEREEILTRVTLTTFNGDVDVQYVDAPISRLKPLTRENYVPDGTTAMLDAVTETIGRLEEGKHREGDSYLVCVISDGYENASRHTTYTNLAERIQQLTGRGNWTFTYLGSNQDLSKISDALHIPAGNVAAYAATPAGTNEAWRRHSQRTSAYMSRTKSDSPAPQAFYEGNDLQEPDENRPK